MAKVEILNYQDHRDLKLNTDFGLEFDDIAPAVAVTAEELPQLALDTPVFIIKNPNTGEFELRVILGFSEGENLFIDGKRWRGAYVPLDVRRQPFQAFLVGSNEEVTIDDVGPDDKLQIGLNVESNRISSSSGQAIFNEDGNISEYVESVSQILSALVGGFKSTKVFLKRLHELSLITPAKLEIELPGEDRFALEGLYGVPLEALKTIPDDVILDFHKNGYMQAIYALMQSQGQLSKLVQWKSDRATA